MKKTTLITLVVVLLAIAFFYFGVGGGGKKDMGRENNPKQQTTGASTSVGLANPAVEFCLQNGGTLSASGEECIFSNGQTCKAWMLFRGECIVEGVNNFATYTSVTSTLSANFWIKTGTVIINSKELNLNFLELKQAVSASGARYLSADNKVEFWEHQGEATVSVDGKQVFVGKIFQGKQ